jgi:hypothetical protein
MTFNKKRGKKVRVGRTTTTPLLFIQPWKEDE